MVTFNMINAAPSFSNKVTMNRRHFLKESAAGLIAYTHHPQKPALNLRDEDFASLPALI